MTNRQKYEAYKKRVKAQLGLTDKECASYATWKMAMNIKE